MRTQPQHQTPPPGIKNVRAWRRRRARMAAGECVACRAPIAPYSTDVCAGCFQKRKQWTLKAQLSKRRRGVCMQCDNPTARKGGWLCAEHQVRRSRSILNRRLSALNLLREHIPPVKPGDQPIGVIYMISNTATNPPMRYIGRTTRSPRARMRRQFYDALAGNKPGLFGEHIREAGDARFQQFVVEEIRPFYSKMEGFFAEHDEIVSRRTSAPEGYNLDTASADAEFKSMARKLKRLQARGGR